MTTASRVRDTRKPITSRTALHQADKTRDTLTTAVAILRASGNDAAADRITPDIVRLNLAIRAYYDGEPRRAEDRVCARHAIRHCTICTPAALETARIARDMAEMKAGVAS